MTGKFIVGKSYKGDSITSHEVKECTLYVKDIKYRGCVLEGEVTFKGREEEKFDVALDIRAFENGVELVLFDVGDDEYMICAD